MGHTVMDPYLILGVVPGTDPADIKRAYYRLLRKNPPEQDVKKFTQIREAYEAIRSGASTEESKGSTPTQELEEALALMKRKRYGTARELLIELYERYGDPRALKHLGLVNAHVSDWGEARRILAQVSKQSPDDGEVWMALGWCELRAPDGNLGAGRIYLQRALEHYPRKSNQIIDLIAESFEREGNLEAAKVWREQLLNVKPKPPPVQKPGSAIKKPPAITKLSGPGRKKAAPRATLRVQIRGLAGSGFDECDLNDLRAIAASFGAVDELIRICVEQEFSGSGWFTAGSTRFGAKHEAKVQPGRCVVLIRTGSQALSTTVSASHGEVWEIRGEANSAHRIVTPLKIVRVKPS